MISNEELIVIIVFMGTNINIYGFHVHAFDYFELLSGKIGTSGTKLGPTRTVKHWSGGIDCSIKGFFWVETSKKHETDS